MQTSNLSKYNVFSTSSSLLAMASISSPLTASAFLIMFITLMTNKYYASGCYPSIFGFGDSITDTGNFLLLASNLNWHVGLSPYGETFFHQPTGRNCDGRIIIDFLAEYFRLPLVPPSIGVTKVFIKTISHGVNFAVAGAMTLNVDFYARMGIIDSVTNITMIDQLNQFKQLLPSLCQTSSSGSRQLQLQSSLVLLGPFGGNDYTHSLQSGKKLDEIPWLVPIVVNAIASAIDELVELGAMTILVPGMLPIGCIPWYLTTFETANAEEYDEIGCLIRLNKLAEYHNELLQRELQQTRGRHPDANIIYADYYDSAMELYRNPTKYGFTRTLKACCGIGGLYNFDSSAPCGIPPSKSCDNPSLFINWDGYHLTEAAYRWISRGLLEGKYTVPPINTTCLSTKVEHFPKKIARLRSFFVF